MRKIVSAEISEPFIVGSMEFVRIKLHGYSFMLHQIRKMVGLVMAVARGRVTEDFLTDFCWKPKRLHIARVPGLGLVLEDLDFKCYSNKLQIHKSDNKHIDFQNYKVIFCNFYF